MSQTPTSPSPELLTVPSRKGKGARISKGQSIRIINTHGKQVLDTWAFSDHHITKRMSMEHTRAHLDRILPTVNDSFATNRRNPALTFIEDTTPGNHDTLMAACDRHLYSKQSGLRIYRDNCTDNLRNAVNEIGEQSQEFSPSSLNVLMNIPVKEGLYLNWDAPTTEKGQ